MTVMLANVFHGVNDIRGSSPGVYSGKLQLPHDAFSAGPGGKRRTPRAVSRAGGALN
ncbi:MAG: hypothetical protein ABIY47_16920 [Opitutaceae bacterium]